jgi:POT family proton-dependent oligopeptide transporter
MTNVADTKPEAAPPVSAAKARHPKELYILFATEMWERFGFYTAAAILTLYLQFGFGWAETKATELWSNYLMLVYLTPAVGGWLADRFLGYRRSVFIGGLFFILGYAMLAMGQVATFYAALILIFIGNGFFKPNISTMVGNLYPPGSPLKDSAYNIFYMGINVGAFLGPIVAEAIRQRIVPQELYERAKQGLALSPAEHDTIRNGFTMAFMAAAIGMTLGTIVFALFARSLAGADILKKKKGVDPDQVAVTEDIPPTHPPTELDRIPERHRILALLVIFGIVVVFWMVFHQNGTTMTYWANANTDWKSSKAIPPIVTLLSLGTVDASQASGVVSNAINAFWIIVLSLPLVKFWSILRKRGLEPSTPVKIALGMVLTALAFLILFVAAKSGGDQTFLTDSAGQILRDEKGVPRVEQGLVSPWWLIAAYGVLSLGELMLSPMGLSLVSKVSPARMTGLMMGGWFVATAIGNKLTMIGVLWPEWYHSSFWLLCSGSAAVMAVVLLFLLRPLKRAMPGV